MQERISGKRRTVLMMGTMVFLACSLLAVPRSAAQTDQPDIKFEQKTYDFGIIQRGDKVSHTFNFKNEGQALLKIKKIKTSCGCTVPKTYTKEVPAGEKGQLEVTFNSKKFMGAIRKTIYVNSNDPDEPVVNLSLKGVIISDVVVIPSRPLAFGLIQKGQSLTKKLIVKQGGSQELKILKVEADLPFISARVIPEPLSKLKSYEVEVTIAPDAPGGVFQGTIKIYTNIKRYSLVEHKVNGIVKTKTDKP